MITNLFGEVLEPELDVAEQFLAERDSQTFDDRARRLRQTIQLYPEGSFMMPMESYVVFNEARSTYVNGDYASTLMMAQAFIEHRMQGYLQAQGRTGLAKSGLAKIVEHCRTQKLFHEVILDGLDKLRKFRNPFTHLRPFDDPDTLSQRSVQQRMHPAGLMEQEAFRAFSLMLTVAMARLPGE